MLVGRYVCVKECFGVGEGADDVGRFIARVKRRLGRLVMR